jgi:ketosteroid isomerase-like protein
MNHAESYTSLLEHFATYFDAVDRADLDTVMRILDGATLSVAGNELSDPTAIRRAYQARQQAPGPDGRLRTKHHLTNLRVTGPAADGTLEAAASYFRLEPGEDCPVVTTSGRLRQVVIRDGDGWRVRRHEIVTDFSSESS